MMVMMDLFSFFLGVIVSSIGIIIGIELKIHINDILYNIMNRMVKTDKDNLKISDLPVDNNDKK